MNLQSAHTKPLKPELLAPAASFDFLRYAFAYGADAVYAGQPQFSLRQRQNGFADMAEVEKAIAYAHQLGKKLYLTANIIPRNNKITPFLSSLDEYLELKPDALIVSDPGIVGHLRKAHPNTEVHLSVQANCTNWMAAKFWYELGVTRIILSRELLMREIAEIHEKVPGVELESFVHGAVCMAHSGRCLLSNYMNYRDANQGHCSNACRFPYQLYTKNEAQQEGYVPLEGEFFISNPQAAKAAGAEPEFMPIDEDEYGTYIMNSRDICGIESLGELFESGVVSFKLEGRTKSLNYLCQTSRSYRQAIDDMMESKPFNPELRQRMDNLDSRGYMDPLKGGKHELMNTPGGDVLPQNFSTSHEVSHGGRVSAFIQGWDSNTGRATISVRGMIQAGQTLQLVTPAGQQNIVAKELISKKSAGVEVLHPGQENCSILLEHNPGDFGILLS